MSQVELNFKQAVHRVRTAPKTQLPPNSVRLDFYSLYKQATEGDVQVPPPSVFRIQARAKWNAWNDMKGMPKDVAKTNYFNLVNTYMDH